MSELDCQPDSCAVTYPSQVFQVRTSLPGETKEATSLFTVQITDSFSGEGRRMGARGGKGTSQGDESFQA